KHPPILTPSLRLLSFCRVYTTITMFDSKIELIAQTASNSLFIFCFCNLIMVVILMGSKSLFNIDQEGENFLSTVTITRTNDKQGTSAMHLVNENKLLQKCQMDRKHLLPTN
ncbi:putative Translation initiation factor IF-2, partial [Quillaja saponaria]